MVRPPARSAPSWAAVSIPMAAPLTTATPAPANPVPISTATSRPRAEQRLAPTTATRVASSSRIAPRTNRAAGGSGRSCNAPGYSAELGPAIRAPQAIMAASTRSGSMVPAHR